MISPETAGQYIIGHLFTNYQAEFRFKTWYLNNYFYVVDLGLMPRERAMRILANETPQGLVLLHNYHMGTPDLSCCRAPL